MRLGMNLLLWGPQVDPVGQRPNFEDLAAIGYDGVEVPISGLEEHECAPIAEVLDAVGLARSAVFHLEADCDPISADASVRQHAVDALRAAVDRAKILGADCIAGPFHSAYKEFCDRGPEDVEFERSAEVLAEAADYARGAGIKLAIEPLNRFECYLCNTIPQARRIVDLADRPNLGLLYDTHHMHIEAKSVEQGLDACGERLVHIHISENDRGTPGSGQVAWAETFAGLKARKYDAWLTIEAFTRADADFAGAVHIWRDFDDAQALPKAAHDFVRQAWAEA